MLPCAKYRHYNYHPVIHAGVTGIAMARGCKQMPPPSNQFLWRRYLKSHRVKHKIFNKADERSQVINTMIRARFKKLSENIYWLGSILQTYYGQHPPPTCLETAAYRVRWKLHWLHPPPHHKGGQSPPVSIRSKDPPPVPVGYTMLYSEPLNRLAWPNSDEHSHWRDRLGLASQHPPPTRGQATVSRARWRLNRERPPPRTRRTAWISVTTDTSLRSSLMQLAAMCIAARSNIALLSIKVRAAIHCLKNIHLKQPAIMLKQLLLGRSYLQTIVQLPIIAPFIRTIDRSRHSTNITDATNVFALSTRRNFSRQILPSNKEIYDHVCLVGIYCLANRVRQRKAYVI